MILLIDNYDSFSYNLYQLVGAIDPDIRVIRNDELRIEEIDALHPARIILSPGPGRPEDAGVLIDVVKTLSPRIPTLGVCLGHQAICAAFGATVTYAKELMHGKQSLVHFDTSSRLFQNCPKTAPVARYHSLAADAATMPDCLKVTAVTDDGEIMAVQHTDYPIYGVQFHPESIMTPNGKTMLVHFDGNRGPDTARSQVVRLPHLGIGRNDSQNLLLRLVGQRTLEQLPEPRADQVESNLEDKDCDDQRCDGIGDAPPLPEEIGTSDTRQRPQRRKGVAAVMPGIGDHARAFDPTPLTHRISV
mgnify:CR=1 FL=1